MPLIKGLIGKPHPGILRAIGKTCSMPLDLRHNYTLVRGHFELKSVLWTQPSRRGARLPSAHLKQKPLERTKKDKQECGLALFK